MNHRAVLLAGLAGLAGSATGCDETAADADMLPPPRFVDARVVDLGGVDATRYFDPGPPFESRCPDDPGLGLPEVYPQPTEFTYFDPPFYVRVVHMQNYGDGPMIIDGVRLEASPAFALYAGYAEQDDTLVMTGGQSYVQLPLCIPPDDTLTLFLRVDSRAGPLEDGRVFLETNRPVEPTICLPIWFGVNNPHDDCP